MRKDIEKLISEITISAVQISAKADAQITVNYSGYSNSLGVFSVRNGDIDTFDNISDIYMNVLSNTEIKKELRKIKRELEKLKEESLWDKHLKL